MKNASCYKIFDFQNFSFTFHNPGRTGDNLTLTEFPVVSFAVRCPARLNLQKSVAFLILATRAGIVPKDGKGRPGSTLGWDWRLHWILLEYVSLIEIYESL